MSVKAIFDHALELPAGAARQAYLDKVCGHGSPPLTAGHGQRPQDRADRAGVKAHQP